MSSRQKRYRRGRNFKYEIQRLEKTQSCQLAFEECEKKDGHERFINVDQLTLQKLHEDLQSAVINPLAEIINKNSYCLNQPESEHLYNELCQQFNIFREIPASEGFEQVKTLLQQLISEEQLNRCNEGKPVSDWLKLIRQVKCFLEGKTDEEIGETWLEKKSLENTLPEDEARQELQNVQNLLHERITRQLERTKLGLDMASKKFSQDLLPFIKLMSTLTVRLCIKYPGGERTMGTGFIHVSPRIQHGNCPCPRQCTGKKPDGKWAKVIVTTALHVLQEEDDAERCMVQLFYDKKSADGDDEPKDDDDRHILCGMKKISVNEDGDYCCLECRVHDEGIIKLLEENTAQYWKLGEALKDKYGKGSEFNFVVIASHPHGMPKTISIGQLLDKKTVNEVREGQDKCKYSYDTATCSGSSGAFVYAVGDMMDGFGYWLGKPHSHSGADVGCNVSGTGEVAREQD